jgi:hypothetical protein
MFYQSIKKTVLYVVMIDPLVPEKALYKVICQYNNHRKIFDWTRNRTNMTVLVSLNTVEWYIQHVTTSSIIKTETVINLLT